MGDGKVSPASDYLDSAYDLQEDPDQIEKGKASNRDTALKRRKGGQQPGKVCKTDDHTIDFIFFAKKYFKIRGRIQIPTFGEVSTATGGENMLLPSWCYPSDHFMLCA